MSRVGGLYTLCLLSSLACKGELEVFRPMQGVLLPLGVFFWGIGPPVQPEAPSCFAVGLVDFVGALNCIP